MISVFETLWRGLVGRRWASPASQPSFNAIDYKSFRIRPVPYQSEGGYQTAGVIEKDFPDGPREHRFIRAEKHPSRDDAATFAVAKGRQIIDQQGDRVFDPR